MKRGTFWIHLGLLLLAAALFLSAYNTMDSRKAGETSRQVIAQMCQALPTETAAETEAPAIPEYLLDAEREMPVLSQWDYPALKVAPCRYSGSLYQDNLIICAHNYASHFGKLKNLHVGDTAIFTDMDENVVSFQLAAQETIQPEDLEAMEAGDWDLTLFTCTVGGQSRVTVRFVRENP